MFVRYKIVKSIKSWCALPSIYHILYSNDKIYHYMLYFFNFKVQLYYGNIFFLCIIQCKVLNIYYLKADKLSLSFFLLKNY